jgi:hypothetical protein
MVGLTARFGFSGCLKAWCAARRAFWKKVGWIFRLPFVDALRQPENVFSR